MEMEKAVELNKILAYEVYSSKIVPYIRWVWLSRILGKYYAWKTVRKYKRCKRSVMIRNEFKRRMLINQNPRK